MNDFLSKSVGSRKADGIIALDAAHAHKIEVAVKENGWIVADSLSEIFNQFRIPNKVIIPVYRMGNTDADTVYALVVGFASGQISLLHENKNITITPKYDSTGFVILTTHDFIRNSNHPWLQTLGMVYQAD